MDMDKCLVVGAWDDERTDGLATVSAPDESEPKTGDERTTDAVGREPNRAEHAQTRLDG